MESSFLCLASDLGHDESLADVSIGQAFVLYFPIVVYANNAVTASAGTISRGWFRWLWTIDRGSMPKA